jgi:hypothetical protein
MKSFLLGLFFVFSAHAMSGSTYDVMNIYTLDKTKLNFNGLKVSASIPANTVQDIDLTLADDHLFTGAQIILTGNCDNDEMQIKIVSGTTVVNQFIDWYATNMTKELPYPAKIPATLKIRATYKNTCLSNAVNVRVNYSLHKVLQ